MLEPGDTVDHYEIKELIGAGSFSLVYAAEDMMLNRVVALKMSNTKQPNPEENALLLEATAMVNMNAPHTTKVLAAGHHEGEAYLIYDHMHQTLRQELTSHGSLSWQNCLRTFLRVAETIDHLHRRGYVHADIRPRNIMYDSRGFAYLSDMAIARRADTVRWDEALNLAQKQAALVKYAPMEARLDPENYVLHTSFDIWSIGLVLYESLTGESLVVAPEELGEGAFPKNFRGPSTVNAEIPGKFDTICKQCLNLDPATRYTSSRLLDDLRKINETEKPFKPKIFISHASHDREFVEQHIVGFLESNGIATWYSKVAIQSAVEWERSILQGLEGTSWFLLVMSKKAAESEWVKDEVFWGIDNRQGKIIPVLIDDVDIGDFHIRLRRIQAIDLRADPDVDNIKIMEILNNSRG